MESYEGPAGVVFTDEELLIIWSDLCRIPDANNGAIRARIKKYLERKKAENGSQQPN